jgi:type I restriction-modification system DNA methylase subunit
MIPSQHRYQIKNAILSLGYTEKMIQEDFCFLGRKGKSIADMVIFGSDRHYNLETACLGICYSQYRNLQILDDFRMLAIPYGILADESNVEIWPIGPEGPQKQQKQDCSYEQLNNYFTKNRIHFSPTSILKAKEQGRQLSFVDLDMGLLYEWGFNATKQKLKLNIESAIENAKSRLPKTHFDKLTRITIRLLAASILHDKDYVKISSGFSATELLKLARAIYPNYFSVEDIKVLDQDIIEKILEDIRSGGCIFTNLTTEMLDHLYQYAFVDEESRKELGIYATPRKLARMIANNLPVEDIRLDDLYLLDGTCGSGSLLVAGHKRIYDLLPVFKSEAEKHDFLSDHILGVDKDNFAAEIAGLSLLHESLPSGNSWKIYVKDFKEIDGYALPERPSLILANPPYREVRGESHIEKAIPFVAKNLDLLIDHGLMAIILPETFLQKSSCKDIRKRILKECEILEIWQLPEGIFEESSSATTILFLRKNLTKPKSFPVRVRRVLNEDRAVFINRGYTSFSYLFPGQDNWNSEHLDFQIIPNIFQRLWEKLKNYKKLGEVAEIRNGITPGPGREDHFCHDNPPKGWKKWINGASAIRPFIVDWENQRRSRNKPYGNRFVNWPGNLYRPIVELKKIFEASNKKIIINARRSPNTRWRLTAAIDEEGYFPGYDLDLIFNFDNDRTIEEIVAVLNHAVTTAWIDDHIRSRDFDIPRLKQIPIPEFDELQKNELKSLVRELMQNPIPAESDKILKQIDAIVDKAYGLTDEEKTILENAGFVREKIDIKRDLKTFLPDRTWIVTAIVEAVDAENNKIKVWFRGFGDDAIEIIIPGEMPGWALRSDLAFEAEIPFEDRYNPDWSKLHNFRPVRYSYMDEAELLKNLEARG